MKSIPEPTARPDDEVLTMTYDADTSGMLTSRSLEQKPIATTQSLGTGYSTITGYSRLAIRLENDLKQEERGSSVLMMAADFDRVAVEASAELAWHLAEDLGRRVLLVDGSFDRSGLTDHLGGADRPGMLDLLANESLCKADILGSMRHTGHVGITFIPVGQIDRKRLFPARPSAVRQFLSLANQLADFVLIQGLAVENASRTLTFGSLVDAALLITLEGELPINKLVSAQQILSECGAQRVGLVIATPRKHSKQP